MAITFANGGMYADTIALPERISRLYLDFETSSGSPKLTSLNPWHNCKPIGAAITWDDNPTAYFTADCSTIIAAVERADLWVNHNVKYDAHVYANNYAALPEQLKLCDTVVGAKIINSDRQFSGGYGLDALAAAWLHEDISGYEAALRPYLYKNKDYGAIPLDILAEYACQDVLTNRRLYKYELAQLPDECAAVYATENSLTRILFEVEQRGVAVNMQELRLKELAILTMLARLDEELATLIGRTISPMSNDDCHEVLCSQFGLPVAGFTEAGKPSFNKHALRSYLVYPNAPVRIVELLLAYRSLSTQYSFFVKPYQALAVDGILHSSYNQIVRTGRLSAKQPNSQQLDKAAKELIHPRPGYSFLSLDYSGIEFRFIVHYIQDAKAIAAFIADPDTDFHSIVADFCNIKRRPAKTVNFMIAFGGGKGKTVQVLSTNPDIVTEIQALLHDQDLSQAAHKAEFERLAVLRAEQVYNTYHETFPNMKKVSKHAEEVAKARGYVRNLSGRRRHMPADHAYIAFNTINQSSAADLLKERTVAVYNELRRIGADIHIVASVHDETLFEGPTEIMESYATQRMLVDIMESPATPLRVPVRCAINVSSKHWRAACADAKPLSAPEVATSAS